MNEISNHQTQLLFNVDDDDVRLAVVARLDAERRKLDAETARITGGCLTPAEMAERLEWLGEYLQRCTRKVLGSISPDAARNRAISHQVWIDVTWAVRQVSSGNFSPPSGEELERLRMRRAPSRQQETRPSAAEFWRQNREAELPATGATGSGPAQKRAMEVDSGRVVVGGPTREQAEEYFRKSKDAEPQSAPGFPSNQDPPRPTMF